MAKEKVTDQMLGFAQASRELGCDEDENSFNTALTSVASAPHKKAAVKRKTKKAAKK